MDRIAHLSRDLLDYAKLWQLACTPLGLAEQARSAARRFSQTELGPGLENKLTVAADPNRLDQG